MKKFEEKKGIESVLNYWNVKMPMMAMEELAECIQAINKYERKKDERSLDNLRKEIADVYISLRAIMRLDEITYEEINIKIEEKLKKKY